MTDSTARIAAEIRRQQAIASLIFSEHKLCQRKARAAIRRLEKLRAKLNAISRTA